MSDTKIILLFPTVFVILHSKPRHYQNPRQHGCLCPACYEPRWIPLHMDNSKNAQHRSVILKEVIAAGVMICPCRTGCGGRTAPSARLAPASELISTETLMPIGAVRPVYHVTIYSDESIISKVKFYCPLQRREPLLSPAPRSTVVPFPSQNQSHRPSPTSCAVTRIQFSSTSASTRILRCCSSHTPAL